MQQSKNSATIASQGDQPPDTQVLVCEESDKKLQRRKFSKQIQKLKTVLDLSKPLEHELFELQEYQARKEDSRIQFDEVNKEELSKYKATWHWMTFLEFLIYHVLFFCFIGPFIMIPFWRQRTLLINMRFCSHSSHFYQQLFLWLASVIGGLFYFIQETSLVTFTEIVFMWFALLIRSVVIAAKYATLSKERIKLYRSQVLPDYMFMFDLMFGDWCVQTGKTLFLEQYRSLRRHEFESTLYKFDFILTPQDETHQSIIQTDICFYIEWSMKQKVMSATDAFVNDRYNGFHIFGYLVQNFQNENSVGMNQLISMFWSLILAITPVFIRIPDFYQDPPSLLDSLRFVLNIINSFIAFSGSFMFLQIGLFDFHRKFYLLDQCLYLLSPKDVHYSSSKKLLPTINFNNPNTLQAWSILRSVAFDYGQTYNIRTQGFYSLIFIAIIVLMFLSLTLILQYLFLSAFQLILLGELTAVLVIYTGMYLYNGAYLNEYFDKFETLLEDIKSIYLDILRLKEEYFTNQIDPINKVHKIFVNIIKQQVGSDIENIVEYLELIISEIDNNLRNVAYDRRNHPFKLYGVIITFNLLKSVAVALSTVYSFAIQQRLGFIFQMSLQLSKIDEKSYNDKYQKVLQGKVLLTYKKTKAILQNQFSISNEEADIILDKAFKLKPGKELDKDGFYIALRYVQCLQNNISLDCDIYKTPLTEKLRVRSQKKAMNSEEHLNKSMAHLNQIQQIAQQPEQFNEMEYAPPDTNQIQIEEIIQDLAQPKQLTQKDEVIDSQINCQEQGRAPDIIEISDDEIEDLNADAKIVNVLKYKVEISSYQLIKEGLLGQGYYTYRIITNVDYHDNGNQHSQKTVERRYNDFNMLNQYISKAYQGKIIPKLPEKESIVMNLSKMFKEPNLEQRREDLELYLRTLSKDFVSDPILLTFLTENDKFEDCLYQLRYAQNQNEVEFGDDDLIPDPSQYLFSSKMLSAVKRVSEYDYSNMVLTYFNKNSVESKFSDEYKQTEQHYQLLQTKYQDLVKFDQEITTFYSQAPQFQFKDQSSEFKDIMKDIHNNFTKSQVNAGSSEVIRKVKFMKSMLVNVFYSYECLQNNVCNWTTQKIKLSARKSTEEDIKKNEAEEQLLRTIIGSLNESLITIIQQYSEKLNQLLDDFVQQLLN